MDKRKLSFILAAVMVVNMVLGMAIPVYADVDERVAMMEELYNAEAIESDNDVVQAAEARLEEAAENEASSSDADGNEGVHGDDMEADATEADPLDATASDAEKAYLTLSDEAEDGVIVVLEADEGVFPDGVTLSATVATPADAEEAQKDIEKIEGDQNVAKRTTYDIKVMLGEEEVQPDNSKGSVKVYFVIPDAPTGADAANIYHHTEDGVETVLENATLSQLDESSDELLEKAELSEIIANSTEDTTDIYAMLDGTIENDVNDNTADDCDDFDEWCNTCDRDDGCDHEDCCDCDDCDAEGNYEAQSASAVALARDPEAPVVLTAEVESFSLYTVDFTYEGKSTSIPGDTEEKIAGVLMSVGITGKIKTATTSENTDGKVDVYEVDGIWMIKALQSFSDEFTLKVTMENDAKYDVKIRTTSGYSLIMRTHDTHATTGFRASQLIEVIPVGFADDATLTYSYVFGNSDEDSVTIEFWKHESMLKDDGEQVTAKIQKKQKGQEVYVEGTYTGVNAAWFAVSMRSVATNSEPADTTLEHTTITVTVKDTDGHSVSKSYTGFAFSSLKDDIQNSNGMIFVDEEMEMTTFYGLSGVVHITCSNATVSNVSVADNEVISVSGTAITGKKVGQTTVSATVNKRSCSHHTGEVANGSVATIAVIKRPVYKLNEDGSVTISNTTEGVKYYIGSDILVCNKDGEELTTTDKSFKPDASYNTTLAKNVNENTFRRPDGFTTGKYEVTPPTLESKTYTGATLKADVTDTDVYKVQQNDGGINVTAEGYDVKLRLKDTTKYQWSGSSEQDTTIKFYITKATNSITDLAISDWTYGGTASNPSGNAKFGDITYYYESADKTTYPKTTAKPTAVGNYTLIAEVTGTTNYDSASATTTFKITKGTVVVTGITANDKTFDGNTDATLNFDGAKFNNTKITNLSVTATGAFTDATVGKNKTVNLSGMSLTGSAAGNYELDAEHSQKTTTATISAIVIDPDTITVDPKVYNSATQSATVTPPTGCTIKTNKGGVDVGKYDVVFTLSEGYEWKDGSTADLTKKFEITPKEVTVNDIKADNKVYDGTTKATLSYTVITISGKYPGDDLSAIATGSFVNKNVGYGKKVNIVDITLIGGDRNNYKLAASGNQTETTADITKKTINVLSGVEAQDKTYDAKKKATISTTGVVFDGLCPGDNLGINAEGEFVDKNASDTPKEITITKFEPTGEDAGNYEIATSSVGTLTAKINQKEVKLSGVKAENKVYDGTTAATISDRGSLAGKIEGDDLGYDITGQHFDSKNAGNNKDVEFTVTLTGMDKDNYKLASDSQAATKANITKRKIFDGIVSGVNAQDKTYDKTVAAVLSTTSESKLYDPATGEYIPILAATGEFLNPDAGKEKDVKITGFVLDDPDGNFDVDYATLNMLNANIFKAVISTPSGQVTYYTSYEQTSTVSATTYYSVKQAKGTDVGKYDVVLTLASPNNYTWPAGITTPDTTVIFEILKAQNVEIEGPSIENWKYGSTPSEPQATPTNATKGEIEYWYKGEKRDGTPFGPTQTPPTDAGKYVVIASVSETPNHPAAQKESAPFYIYPIVVQEPTVASKSYTGYNQIADIASTSEYTIDENYGGIHAGIYPVIPKLRDPNNYMWSKEDFMPVKATTSVPFEILKATDNEIPENELEEGFKDWIYWASPSVPASPSVSPKYGTPSSLKVQPKYGTPSYTFYQEQPDGTWKILASSSEEPYKTATPTEVGHYKVVIEVPGTDDWEPITKEWDFWIYPALIQLPSAPDKVYTGSRQIAWLYASTPSEEYSILQNDGGIEVGSYPVVLEAGKNYLWDLGTATASIATISFAIIPDPIDPKTPEEKAKGETYTSGNATIKVWTKKEEGAPKTYIDNLNLALAYKLLTSDEQALYDSGENMAAEIRLEVRPKDESSLSQKEKDEIKKQIDSITNGQLGVYLDLTLWKDVTIGTSPMYSTALHDTAPNTIRIRVSVPENLRKQNRTYYVARVHDDIGTILPTEQVADTWIDLDFETTKFSTYAILYSDPTSGGGGGTTKTEKWWKPTDSGWVKRPGTEDWYVIRNDELVKGWFHDNEDAFWYYLDTNSGIMKSGWQQIGGKWYYFTPIDQVPEGTWFYDQNGDGKWHYYGDKSFHTYGSMYCNEQTPDGYWVDDTGALIGEGGEWWSEEEADAGWVRKTGTTDWYYIKNNTLKKGWHDDQEDGHRYYLDPITGIMFKDWNKIGNYMYYFTTDADVPEQTWFNDRTADGKWHYYGNGNVLHPLGSMFSNEVTPDGHTVSASGVLLN